MIVTQLKNNKSIVFIFLLSLLKVTSFFPGSCGSSSCPLLPPFTGTPGNSPSPLLTPATSTLSLSASSTTPLPFSPCCTFGLRAAAAAAARHCILTADSIPPNSCTSLQAEIGSDPMVIGSELPGPSERGGGGGGGRNCT